MRNDGEKWKEELRPSKALCHEVLFDIWAHTPAEGTVYLDLLLVKSARYFAVVTSWTVTTEHTDTFNN